MKITLSKEEAIPFLEEDGKPMQMIRSKIYVSVTNEEGETEDQTKDKLDKLFKEQQEDLLSSDNIYQKLKKQRDYLFETLKQELSKEKVKEIINYLK